MNIINDIECYNSLAIAIIKQACDDYCNDEITDEEFEKFCNSSYYDMLTNIDGKLLFNKVKEKKYGRKKNSKRNKK